MSKLILRELKSHAPFTLFGALTGLIIMFLSKGLSSETSHHVFYTLHPIHVVLSALVTASMYKLHNCRDKKGKCNPWILLVIGYVGSIGITTMSDSLIPYIGEVLLHMPNKGVHIGFIETLLRGATLSHRRRYAPWATEESKPRRPRER